MDNIIRFIEANLKYLIPGLLILYALISATTGAWEGIKQYFLYRKVLKVNRGGVVSSFLNKIAELPPDVVSQALSNVLLPIDADLYLEKLVRDHTQVLPKPTLVGIHDKPTGKVKTKYYVDVLSACCDAQTRRKLAQMVALKITEIVRKEKYTFDAIAVSARGNVLLAAEIGDLLDKPIVLFGDLAGVSFPVRFNAMHKKPERYIIIDGLSATGEEIIYVANLVKAINADARFVFTVIDRCFGAKDRARNESPFDHPVELVFIAEYDDRKCAGLFKSSN
jgi:orotate phosphoribosyltransferase